MPGPTGAPAVRVAVCVLVVVVLVSTVVGTVLVIVAVLVIVTPRSNWICAEVVGPMVVSGPGEVSGFRSLPKVSKEPITCTPPSSSVVVAGPVLSKPPR